MHPEEFTTDKRKICRSVDCEWNADCKGTDCLRRLQYPSSIEVKGREPFNFNESGMEPLQSSMVWMIAYFSVWKWISTVVTTNDTSDILKCQEMSVSDLLIDLFWMWSWYVVPGSIIKPSFFWSSSQWAFFIQGMKIDSLQLIQCSSLWSKYRTNKDLYNWIYK